MTQLEPTAECDVAVVGAGIVGLAAARELSLRHDGIRIVVLERESRIAAHQTSHSSGVIHAGIYYRPGSLRARLCVAGASELYRYCEERGIPTRRAGKLIIATDEHELGRLRELERRALANAVPGVERVDGDRIRELEPHATGIAALHSPATGVVDFAAVAAALAAEVSAGVGTIETGCGVVAITEDSRGAWVEHARGRLRSRAAVICAGAWADRLAVAAGAAREPRIVPFRGAYLRLRPERAGLVRGSIYPVPDPALPFLGSHLTRTIGGDVLLGPSALIVAARDAYRPSRVNARDLIETLSWPGTVRLAGLHWRTGLAEIRRALSARAFVADARRYVPDLRREDFVAGPAGIRGQAVARDGTLVDDFLVSRTERAVYVRNAPSPAATSSLALARLIADEVDPLLTVGASAG
jgi:(S)-2-hydroxyglutarate dehydrogenase